MRPLILRNLLHHKWAFGAAFAAIAACALIVSACGVLAATAVRAAVPPERLAGAPIVVVGDQSLTLPGEDRQRAWLPERVRLDRDVADLLRVVPGVEEVVEDVAFPAILLPVAGEREPARAVGQGWGTARLAPYELRAGAPPEIPGQIVLDAGLAAGTGAGVGARVTVEVHGVAQTFTVTGLAAPAPGRTIARPSLFFSDFEAHGLAGHPGTADALAVLPAAGVPSGVLEREVATALSGRRAVTLTGDARGMAEHFTGRADTANLTDITASLAGLTLLISMLVVAGSLHLLSRHRATEVRVLHAMGMDAAGIRRMVLGEAAVVCAAAVLAGSLAGPYLASWLFDQLVDGGAVPAQLLFHASPGAVIAAACACLAAGIAAAYLPARRISRIRYDGRHSRRRPAPAVPSFICLATGGLLVIATVVEMHPPELGLTGVATVIVSLGVALAAPRLITFVTALLARPVRVLSVRTAHLALLHARGRPGATAMAILPIMLATCLATANLYLQSSQGDAAARVFGQNLRADAVLENSAGGLAPAALDRAAAHPGIAATAGLVTSRAFVAHPRDSWQRDEGYPIHGITPGGLAEPAAFPLAAGSLADLRGPAVALGAEHARRLGLDLGDRLGLWLGDGAPVNARVVALLTVRTGAESLLVPADLLAPHTTATFPTRVLVRVESGANVRRAGAAIGLPAAAPIDPDRHVRAWTNYLLTGVICVFTAIAVISQQASTAARRRRELRVQQVAGATRGQMARTLGFEAVLVTVIGVVLGTAAVTPVLIPYAVAVNGSPLPSAPAWIHLSVVGSATLSALVATLSPMWRTGARQGWIGVGRRPAPR